MAFVIVVFYGSQAASSILKNSQEIIQSHKLLTVRAEGESVYLWEHPKVIIK